MREDGKRVLSPRQSVNPAFPHLLNFSVSSDLISKPIAGIVVSGRFIAPGRRQLGRITTQGSDVSRVGRETWMSSPDYDSVGCL